MNNAPEQFAIELGRAAKKCGHLLRQLRPVDRDDAIASAMLECWEHREARDPEVTLDVWFADALRASIRHIKRSTRSRGYSDMKLEEIASPDSTARSAEAHIFAEQLVLQLTHREQQVATRLAEGYSLAEIADEFKLTRLAIKKITRKLRKLSTDISDDNPRVPYAPGPDSDHTEREPAPIDHAIEQLLRRPVTERADCPPCWKCMYFEGWTPIQYKPPTLVEPEVQAAVAATEARKIAIGEGRTQ
jgi:RNA polymerase sigma factor (sigma-70 family)